MFRDEDQAIEAREAEKLAALEATDEDESVIPRQSRGILSSDDSDIAVVAEASQKTKQPVKKTAKK
jgi:hypothetical protein